jgi:hypothetical protein
MAVGMGSTSMGAGRKLLGAEHRLGSNLTPKRERRLVAEQSLKSGVAGCMMAIEFGAVAGNIGVPAERTVVGAERSGVGAVNIRLEAGSTGQASS